MWILGSVLSFVMLSSQAGCPLEGSDQCSTTSDDVHNHIAHDTSDAETMTIENPLPSVTTPDKGFITKLVKETLADYLPPDGSGSWPEPTRRHVSRYYVAACIGLSF